MASSATSTTARATPPKTDKGDIAVGRFPVRTAAEAKIMVDKTLAYVANENAGSWQNVIMFMGDDGNENQHMDDADMLASLVEEMNPTLYVKRVMWDAYARESSSTGYSYPDVTKVITAQQNAGALVMNYSGHGRADMISHEGVLKIADFEAFTNTNLPLWITASCDIMPFDTQQETIGETAVLNENGGAVAFFGTTRTVYVDRNRAMNKAYIEALLTPVDSVYNTIGEAQRLAKNSLITTGTDVTLNKLQYSLLGDPAIRLNVPTHAAVIDSINGVAVTSASELPALKAGSIASVKGHINIIGTESLDTNFNGTMTAVVRDAEKTVTCRLNNTGSDGASEAFVYTDRDNVLYNGSNTVTGGEFEFSFAVPMDIDYSNESGLINIFAVNTTTLETVNGYNEDFTVGGTETVQNDSIGPSVYCYLNSTSFVNGGNVNTTPYFVAEIMDQDGVNASGSGIGHNMILTIDNDATKSYDLTDNFTFDFGSYTQGTTYYSIPALDEGKHTLSFRAWDVLNNSSTTELTFNVVSGLRPGTLDVSLTDNPAFTTTTFTITHDRAGSNIDIEIDVFDVSGRVVWNHSESGTSTSSTYTVEWDLTNSYGARLGTGIYICRVRVSSDGSGPLAKNQKLVIVKR